MIFFTVSLYMAGLSSLMIMLQGFRVQLEVEYAYAAVRYAQKTKRWPGR